MSLDDGVCVCRNVLLAWQKILTPDNHRRVHSRKGVGGSERWVFESWARSHVFGYQATTKFTLRRSGGEIRVGGVR